MFGAKAENILVYINDFSCAKRLIAAKYTSTTLVAI